MDSDIRKNLENRNSHLANKLQELWKLGEDQFFDMITEAGYTSHGLQHYVALQDNLNKMLPESKANELNEIEIFILITAVIFHDIGMMDADYPGQDIEQRREDHAERSNEWIITNLPKYNVPLSIATRIGEIARGHGLSSLSKLREENAYVNEGIYEGHVRIGLLTALLRISDMLDWAKNRSPLWLANLKNIPISSHKHWQMHNFIESIEIRNSDWKIIIHSNPKGSFSREQVIKVKTWMDIELKECRSRFQSFQLFYSEVEIDEIPYSKEIATDSEIKSGSNPFPLLAPYDRNSREVFFGRELEIESIFSNTMKYGSIILTGESGAGKTSILKAGVVPALIEFDLTPIYLDKYLNPIDDIISELPKRFIKNNNKINLIDIIKFTLKNRLRVILILDQFETAFEDSKTKPFLLNLIKLLKQKQFDVPVIFGITSESILHLVNLSQKNQLGLFDNDHELVVNIERINKNVAKEIIIKSFGFLEITVEQEAINKLILHIIEKPSNTVFLPHLQIVCHRLAKLAIEKKESNVSSKTIGILDLPSELLSSYYDEICENFSKLGLLILSLLIDSEGKRITVTEKRLNQIAKISEEISHEILNLEHNRIIRNREGNIELVHDLLALGIHKRLDKQHIKGKQAKETLGGLIKDWKKNKNVLADPYRLFQIYSLKDNINVNNEEARFLLTSGLAHGILFWYWLFKLRELEGNVIPVLKDMLKIVNPNIRLNAVKALTRFLDVNESLVELLNDENEKVKLYAIEGLKFNNENEAMTALQPLLYVESKSIKIAILNKIQFLKGVELESYLIERLQVEKDVECLKLLIKALNNSNSNLVAETLFLQIKEFQKSNEEMQRSVYDQSNTKYNELIQLSFNILGEIGISTLWNEIIQFGIEYGFNIVSKCLANNLDKIKLNEFFDQVKHGNSVMTNDQFKMIIDNISKKELMNEAIKLAKVNKYKEIEKSIQYYERKFDKKKQKQHSLQNLESNCFNTRCEALAEAVKNKYFNFEEVLKHHYKLEKDLLKELKRKMALLTIAENKIYLQTLISQNKKEGNYGIQSRLNDLNYIQLPETNDSIIIKELENISKRHIRLIQTSKNFIQAKYPFLTKKYIDFSKEENNKLLIYMTINAYENALNVLNYINIYLYPLSDSKFQPETKLKEISDLQKLGEAVIHAFKIAMNWFDSESIEFKILERLFNECKIVTDNCKKLPSIYFDNKILREISNKLVRPFKESRDTIIKSAIDIDNNQTKIFLKKIYYYDDLDIRDYLSLKKDRNLKKYMEQLWQKFDSDQLITDNLLSINKPFSYFRSMADYNDKNAIDRAKKNIFSEDSIVARWALYTVYLSTDPEKINIIESILWRNNEWHKETAIDYLVELENEKVIEKILPFLNDQSEKIRSKVVNVINNLDWNITKSIFQDEKEDS